PSIAVALARQTGSNDPDVTAPQAGAPLTVNGSGGPNRVNLGNAGSLANVLGTVSLPANGAFSLHDVTVTVDDSQDATGRTATLQSMTTDPLQLFLHYELDWAGLGSLKFDPLAVKALTIKGGTGANEFDFLTTPGFASTTLDTLYGNDTVNVLGTTGPLAITSSVTDATVDQAHDTVTVGSRWSPPRNGPPANNGSLANVRATVVVSNRSGGTNVTADDSANASPQDYMFTNLAVSRGSLNAPGPQLGVTNGGVDSLFFRAGSGTDNMTVLGT